MVNITEVLSEAEDIDREVARHYIQEFSRDRLRYEELAQEFPRIAEKYDREELDRAGHLLEDAENNSEDFYFTNLGEETRQPAVDYTQETAVRDSRTGVDEPFPESPELTETERLEKEVEREFSTSY